MLLDRGGAIAPAEQLEIGRDVVGTERPQRETLHVAPGAFVRRRCIVPVDNFYEWKKLDSGKTKQPYAIGLEGGGLMALAGLWETWKSRASTETVRSFTIVTTTPNALCADLHNRMPVILPPGTWSTWLGGEAAEADQLKSLMVPYTGEMVAWPVSQRVGNVKNNDASLIEPISA